MNQNRIARVASVHRGLYKVLIDADTINCRLPGSFDGDLPAVGDWVRVDENNQLLEVLPRHNAIMRKAAGNVASESQTIAANIDIAFIVTSLNQDFNPRRIERYLALLQIQSIPHRLVLTKSDICPNLQGYLDDLKELGLENPPIVTSVRDGSGLAEISAYLEAGKTAVFIGSSGVGKSSIINYLLDGDVMAVSEISEMKDKGRHTTTHRELLMLPNGAAIIDSPGMRELQLWGGDGEVTAFEDIEELAQGCKYRDCRHEAEPGCAVLEAISDGRLDAARLSSYMKLKREAARADKVSRLKENRLAKRRR